MRAPFWIVLLAVVTAAFAFFFWNRDWLEHSQDTVIRLAASKYAVEPALVKAIVWRESRFNPRAIGRVQELGLMQLREEAAREWAEAEHIIRFDHLHCLDPRTNTLAGTWYLRKLLRRYAFTDNPLPYALADYNAGRGNVLKWATAQAHTNSSLFVEQIGFPGTKAYVRDVTARYEYYRPRFR